MRVAFLLTLISCGAAQAEEFAPKMTHAYKQVGDLKINADVYSYADERVRPVVVWIHGGALIMGHRESIPRWLQDACKEAGYVLVSIDYRLAPETKLPE